MAPMTFTRLALFDLDHTLLPIDSADGWSHFLVHAAGLDAARYGAEIRRFAADYKAGRFDVEGYLAFQMGLLARFPREQLELWRTAFLRSQVFPQMRFEAQTLVEKHRSDGFTVAIVTGTHSFVTRPIAALFGIEHLIAVEPEEADGRFTGRYVPPHTYQEGKVRATEAFLARHGTSLDALDDSVFYSDSINDLPLLERVKRPVVTNGDARLKAIAAERGWPTLELFDLVKAA
jgi:HAD superfamily hydrolase (TIGR01490 family)